MGGFVAFMRSPIGRVIRFALGAFLFWIGFFGTAGIVVGVIGIVPMAAGLINFCVLAPLFGYTIWGQKRGVVATK